jgi:hypothetical protein
VTYPCLNINRFHNNIFLVSTKDNKSVEYPAWDDLRAEDREEKSYLLLLFQMIKETLSANLKKGLNKD